MGHCPICQDKIKEFDKASKAHICINKDVEGHIHVHGDITSKDNMQELLTVAAQEIDLPMMKAGQKVPAEVVFHNRQRIGDMLVFTCGVRDFKAAFPHVRVNVISTAGHIWDHNPNIDRTLTPTEANTVKIGPGSLTNASNRKDWHFCNAYRVSIEEKLGVNIPQGESRPDIYLTQEEYDAPRLIEKPYWIICTNGEKGWGCKMYPHVKWQEVVDQNPGILFVQIGTAEDNAPRLQGPNVLDYIGKTQSKDTGIRDLFKLFLNAEGSIGLVSFHMHLSGALYKPAVVVAGAREPVHFTRYPGHAYLATDGTLPCAIKACWHCSIDACTNLVTDSGEKVPKCVDMIESEDVTRALRSYYKGGRLVMDKPSTKPKLKNVVPTPPKPVVANSPQQSVVANLPQVETYGMKFGGGALTDRDWIFINEAMNRYGVKSILEFGAGLSTLLFNDTKARIVTYETSPGWIAKIKTIKPTADVRLWDGNLPTELWVDIPLTFDMCFVDGPAGGINREFSTQTAAMLASVVIVHDAGREFEKKWQAKYLAEGFEGPIKGGHRCHLWVKRGKKAIPGDVPRETELVMEKEKSCEISSVNPCGSGIVAAAPKKIKIVSTARGWGGCARSVTTIMRMLLTAGHEVEFIPFRNAVGSREFNEILKGPLSNVKVTLDYSTLHEACDVLLMYADDYVWEFANPLTADFFNHIGAERKIMMLNYRRGKVGEIPWTRGWDKYMFLNSTQEDELLKVHPGVATKVLPPCVDLAPFFSVKPDYEGALRLVRHSSQGDTKFPKDFVEAVAFMRLAQPHELHLLPGPSFLPAGGHVFKYGRTDQPQVIADFLARGNCFWYSLPEGYMDMGPRVILEAMAAGLPVLADNWGGAIDRVTPECGWLFDKKEDHALILKTMTPAVLKKKGEAARARAHDNFAPEAWLRELLR